MSEKCLSDLRFGPPSSAANAQHMADTLRELEDKIRGSATAKFFVGPYLNDASNILARRVAELDHEIDRCRRALDQMCDASNKALTERDKLRAAIELIEGAENA